VIALMTVLPVSKQLFPQSALFEHRGVQHLLLLEARHTIRPSPVVNLLREVCSTRQLSRALRAAMARASWRPVNLPPD